MQLILNVALVVLASAAVSFLILVKLHRQLTHMIEGRLYQELSRKLPIDVQAKYRASARELALHFALFALLGLAVGLSVYLEDGLIPSLLTGAFGLTVFCFLVREVMRNFRVEEERNRNLIRDVVETPAHFSNLSARHPGESRDPSL